jgi:ABC-type transport system substrate-binding protein
MLRSFHVVTAAGLQSMYRSEAGEREDRTPVGPVAPDRHQRIAADGVIDVARQQRDPAAAGELWSRIDHELVDRAPWVPLYKPRTVTALGPRVGNYKYHPFWNVLLDQLWVR